MTQKRRRINDAIANQSATGKARRTFVHLANRALKYAIDWLALRANPPQVVDGPQRVYVSNVDAPARTGGKRWDVLRDWLKQQNPLPQGILVSFADVQMLLGGALPSSALKHASWWSNKSFDEQQTQAWLDANWEVAKVDFGLKQVIFQPKQTAPATPESNHVEAKADTGPEVKSEAKTDAKIASQSS